MIDLELNIQLVSSSPWVKAPAFVVCPAAGRVFNVSVDPSGLQSGDAHLAFVSGFDASRPNQGALFRLPIAVVRPVPITCCPLLQEAAVIRKLGNRCSAGSLHR